MDICGVRYVLAVCETGSFTEAARLCGVSQPSVTTAVKRVERAVGGPLFLRRRPVRLTPLGEALRPAFEAMRQASDTIAALTAEVKSGRPMHRRSTGAGGDRACLDAGTAPLCRFPGACKHQIVADSLQRSPRLPSRRQLEDPPGT